MRLAAQALGISVDEVQKHGKVFAHRGEASRSVDLGRLASVAAMASATHGVAPGLEATHFFQPPDASAVEDAMAERGCAWA